MNYPQIPRPFSTAAAAALVLLCLAATGCDEMAGKAMEAALGKGEAAPNSLAAKLKAEQAMCPRQINEHTTLKSVSLRGVNRIKYLYVVSESGRPEVNMTVQGKVRRQVIERTKTSHLGPSIVKMDLGVDHFFQDADGKCLLWLEMGKRDFEGLEFEKPSKQIAKAPLPAAPTVADRAEMLAKVKVAQAECPIEIDDHTTLKKIILKGTNRIKYLYVVQDEGVINVNMNTETEVRQQVIERTNASPLGEQIVKMDMGVEHFFQGTDGRCLLWLNMTRRDFQGGGQDAEPEPEPEAVAESESEEGLTPVTTVKPLIPEQFQGVFGGEGHPAGVQTNPFVK